MASGFKRKSRRKDTPENEDIIEKLTAPEGRRIFRLRPGMPEDKIRKIYYKKIQSGHKKKSGAIPYDTGGADRFHPPRRFRGRPGIYAHL